MYVFRVRRSALERYHPVSIDHLVELRTLAVVLSGSGFNDYEYIVHPSRADHLHNPGIGQT